MRNARLLAFALCVVSSVLAEEESAHHLIVDTFDKNADLALNYTEARMLFDALVAPNTMAKVDGMSACVLAVQGRGDGTLDVKDGAENVTLTDDIHELLLTGVAMKLSGKCLVDMEYSIGGHEEDDHAHGGEDEHDDTDDGAHYVEEFVEIVAGVHSGSLSVTALKELFERLVPAGHAQHAHDETADRHAHRRRAATLGDEHDHDHDAGEACRDVAAILEAAGIQDDASGEALVAAVEMMTLASLSGCTQKEGYGCSPPGTAAKWGLTMLAVGLVTLIGGAAVVVVVPLFRINPLLLELMMAFAVGVLLGDVFLHIVPILLGVHAHGDGHDEHGLENELSQNEVLGRMIVVCATVLAFYIIEFWSMALTEGRGGHAHAQDAPCDGPAAEPLCNPIVPKFASFEHVSECPLEVIANGARNKFPSSPIEEALLPVDPGAAPEAKDGGLCSGWVSPRLFSRLVTVVLIADGLHNVTDGIAIAASFSKSPALGWTATVAIALHEVPQELADFAILLLAGLPMSQAIACNVLSGAVAFLGAVLSLAITDANEDAESWFLCVTAGSFVYLAVGVVGPELLSKVASVHAVQFLLHVFGVVAGVLVMWVIAKTESHGSCGHH